MAENIKEFLTNVQNSVDAYLDNFLRVRVENSVLLDSMKYSLFAPGKKIRSAFLIACNKIFNKSIEVAIPPAAVIECIHTYSLIHDDLPSMDDDRVRRGKPTNHLIYGDGIAILAGDALLTLAFNILADKNWEISDEVRIKIMGTVARKAGANGMVGGQALELSINNDDIDEKKLFSIYKMKSADLFSASCKIGGIISCRTQDEIDILENFGEKIGLCFQINDDLHDIERDRQKSEHKNGLTLVNLVGEEYARKRANEFFAQAMDEITKFGKQDIAILKELAQSILEN